MKYIALMVVGAVVVMCSAGIGWCHGVDGYVEKANGYCVTAEYDDGEPMSYAAVEIRAPGAKVGFQTGRTDRNGCFLFRPDGQGRWQAIVQDGMGHRLSLDLEVGAEKDPEASTDNSSQTALRKLNRPVGVMTGLSVIFGLCGFIYGWKARRDK